jgi:hypothetical protein
MYSIFYGVLGLFGWALIAILMATTLSTGQLPRYSQLDSPIAVSGNSLNPGMGVRPHLGYSAAAIANSAGYTETMKLILTDYVARLMPMNSTNAPVFCGVVNSTLSIASTVSQACVYDLTGYMADVNCTASNNYGYNDTQARPCVLVKINNVKRALFIRID